MKHPFRSPRSATARTFAAAGAALLALTLLSGGLGTPAHATETARPEHASAGSVVPAGAGRDAAGTEPRR